MNSTNIDDKIIVRARQQFLLARFKSTYGDASTAIPKDVQDASRKALEFYSLKNLSVVPKVGELEGYIKELDALPTLDPKLQLHIRVAKTGAEALVRGKDLDLVTFYTLVDDLLLPYLDSIYRSDIKPDDHQIFLDLTDKYENRFFEDMRSLNVLEPDQLTRVTEFVPQIVAFIEKIIANGFAYTTTDGVYFDTDAFQKAGFPYARLAPWSKNDQELQADGEGSLSQTDTKRSDSHFALWKASKPGEPAWPSPFGMGRPGWHIEWYVSKSQCQ